MPHRKTLSRLAVASLAAVTLAAPAAVAQPMDMHASTVHKPTPAKVDLRGEAAADSKATPAKVDLRGEAAVDATRAPVTRAPITRAPLPGPPTWPMHPTPLPVNRTAPVAVDGGSDTDVPASVLIIAGTLLAAGGMGAVALYTRPRTRTAL